MWICVSHRQSIICLVHIKCPTLDIALFTWVSCVKSSALWLLSGSCLAWCNGTTVHRMQTYHHFSPLPKVFTSSHTLSELVLAFFSTKGRRLSCSVMGKPLVISSLSVCELCQCHVDCESEAWCRCCWLQMQGSWKCGMLQLTCPVQCVQWWLTTLSLYTLSYVNTILFHSTQYE